MTGPAALATIIMLSVTSAYGAADANMRLSPDSSLAASRQEMSRLFTTIYDTPVAEQFRMPVSLNTLGVKYGQDKSNGIISAIVGSGHYEACVHAEAYTKYKTSTLWGAASYTKGKRYDLKWIENADPEIVYPYFTADSVGGDLDVEYYRFMGGYADHRNRWYWGVRLSYDAGLQYRNVDPRPKNTTGLLSADVSAGYRMTGPYILAVTAAYQRYTQSNDIEFVSEMGESKIFHTTGMGTHYERFAGNGHTSSYRGNVYGGSLTLIPGYGKGFVATAGYSFFKFDKIINDLNKLPLAYAEEHDVKAEIGYRSHGAGISARPVSQWGIRAYFNNAKRTGHENEFGDPAAGIYPKTGARERYHSHSYRLGLGVLWQISRDLKHFLSIVPGVEYGHFNQNYLKPVRVMTIDDMKARLKVQGGFGLPFRLTSAASLQGEICAPVRKLLYIDRKRQDDDKGLTDAVVTEYDIISRGSGSIGAGIALSRAINRKFSIEIDARYGHTFHARSIHTDEWNAGVSLHF